MKGIFDMDDIWIFFLIPLGILIFKNMILLDRGYIRHGGLVGKSVEWFVALMMVIGILRAFEASFF